MDIEILLADIKTFILCGLETSDVANIKPRQMGSQVPAPQSDVTQMAMT